MTIKMTERIQASIIALQAYKKWLWANKVVLHGENAKWDQIDERAVASYWMTIRPEGTDKTDACLYAALTYPIELTMNVETNELSNRFRFGWG